MTDEALTGARERTLGANAGWMIVLLVAVVGLAYVKWFPYYHKAVAAYGTHSVGSSILTGEASQLPPVSLLAALDYAAVYGKAIWKALILALLLGSAVQSLLPRRWIYSTLGHSGLRSVLIGGVMSLPGMMCTCCAAPIVAGLRACRASPGGAVAFWLGNTVLNPATLIFTGLVLGWKWSALRIVIGLLAVFGLGWLVNRVAAAGEAVEAVAAEAGRKDPRGPGERESAPSLTAWLGALGRMSLRLIPEYAVLVLILGAARAWLFPQVGHAVDDSLLWILAFAISGAVFVVPTAGEIPIVQTMLLLGVGAGPAAALLLTLPPISAPSVAMLWKSLSGRTLLLVTLGVIALGTLGGLAAAALFS